MQYFTSLWLFPANKHSILLVLLLKPLVQRLKVLQESARIHLSLSSDRFHRIRPWSRRAHAQHRFKYISRLGILIDIALVKLFIWVIRLVLACFLTQCTMELELNYETYEISIKNNNEIDFSMNRKNSTSDKGHLKWCGTLRRDRNPPQSGRLAARFPDTSQSVPTTCNCNLRGWFFRRKCPNATSPSSTRTART